VLFAQEKIVSAGGDKKQFDFRKEQHHGKLNIIGLVQKPNKGNLK